MDDKAIKVLIADDHTLFRKGMSMMVKTFPGVVSVHDVENGQKALDYLGENPVDILLLDLEMPVLDGWETSRKVVNNFPDTYIIMISMHDSLKLISDLKNSKKPKERLFPAPWRRYGCCPRRG